MFRPGEEFIMRVLIVDDSRLARLMLRRALPPRLAADVIEASGGSEALARVASEPIDVMFLDLTMSDLDGYQVLEAMQKTGRMPMTIVVSADVQPLAQKRVRELGATAFVPKTVNQRDLTTVLESAGLL
jgi:CheY-like chemotaxis protein